MNRNYLTFLLRREQRFYRIPLLVLAAALPLLQLSLFGFRLYRACRALYRWQKGSYLLMADVKAESLAALLNRSGALPLFWAAVLVMLVLMLPAFLSDIWEGRNIDTLMRLPFSRLHYYGVRTLTPAAVLLILWLEEFLLLFLMKGMYLLAVPEICLPQVVGFAGSGIWEVWYSGCLGGFGAVFLLPAAVTLTAFAVRGRDFRCIIGAALGAAAALLWGIGVLPGWTVPLSAAAVIWFGSFAVRHLTTF